MLFKGRQMNRAAEYRAKRSNRPRPTAHLRLPSGAEFLVTRPPLEVWIAAGRFPQSFMKAALAGPGADVAPQTDEEVLGALAFIRQAIIEAVVEPRLVPGTTAEDELDPADLAPEDFEFLTQWILQGSPNVPVATEGGQVSTDDLQKFRKGRRRGAAVPEPDGEAVLAATVPAAGAA